MPEELLSPELTPAPTLPPIFAPVAPLVAEAHWYAQLDVHDVCVAISMLSGPVESAALISIQGGDHSLLGQAYDRATGTFVPPEPTPALAPETKITKLAFRSRFTKPEKAIIEMAALDDSAATMQARIAAASLRADLADQRDATYIDLSLDTLRGGVEVLEHFGLIAVGRAAEILDAPIQDFERYKS